MDVALVALAVLAVVTVKMASRARAAPAANMRISGGRKSLAQNLFDRV